MKRWIIVLLATLLGFGAAQAGSLDDLFGGVNELPDPKKLLSGGAMLYDEHMVLDDGKYAIAYAYPMPEDWAVFLQSYTAMCSAVGYTVQKSEQLKCPAWQVSSKGLHAWLIPSYKGCLLVVVEKGIPFQPVPTPAPTLTPRPTAAPTQVPSGHWEYIEVNQDCFACVNGVCSLCKGTGTYRVYGASVSCSTTCETCDGVGSWKIKNAVWVYE